MSNDDVLIRPGMADDIPALTEIFNHYIEHSNARFTTEPMTLDSCRTWFGGYGAGRYRLLVAQDASGVLGAAYSSRYRPSSAFDTTVETSIYMHPARRRGGIGTRLYGQLIELLQGEDVHLAVAGVASQMRRRMPCIAGWASRRSAPSRTMRASAAHGSVRHGSSAASVAMAERRPLTIREGKDDLSPTAGAVRWPSVQCEGQNIDGSGRESANERS